MLVVSLHVLLLWWKCAFSSLSVALERRSEMAGDNLLSYFQVSLWIDMTCDQNQTSNSPFVHYMVILSFVCTEWTAHPGSDKKIIFIASCLFPCYISTVAGRNQSLAITSTADFFGIFLQ